jgi:hypothetical protein
VKSYIKIWGPPVGKAIRTLEKIAIDMPQVCVMDTFIEFVNPVSDKEVGEYFAPVAPVERKRCSNIISRSGEKTGDFDFIFEWPKKPSHDELNMLIEKIDAELAPLGCKYSIITK